MSLRLMILVPETETLIIGKSLMALATASIKIGVNHYIAQYKYFYVFELLKKLIYLHLLSAVFILLTASFSSASLLA